VYAKVVIMNTIKTFTFSLHQATNVLNAFQRLSGAGMTARLSYVAARNLAALAGTAEVVAAEQTRAKLVEKHGRPREGGGFEVTQENMAAFQAEFAQFGAEMCEVKLQVFPKDAIDHFPPISPADLLVLEPFIEGDEPAPAKPAKKKGR
jgi:hypothetical protein